jgi:glucosamine--fructose-6-phosphate aminotransferase (isomerizing)
LHDQLAELRRVPSIRGGRRLVFTGMGGSYDACYAPVTDLAAAGIGGVMVDSAELLYFRRPILTGGTLMVVVSQSGESAEVVRLIDELDGAAGRPFVVSITNGLANTLSRKANVALDSRAGREQGPSSMTFAAALVVLKAVAGVLAGGSADDVVERVTTIAASLADSTERVLQAGNHGIRIRDWLGGRSVLILLGRGAARAAAEMGALTLKEAARFPAEAMEAAQFRHGPLELASRDSAVLMIATEAATWEVDRRLAGELVDAGVAVLQVVCDGVGLPGVETISIGDLDPMLAPAAAIIPVQLLAWRLAVERGLEPGTYTRAAKITSHE